MFVPPATMLRPKAAPGEPALTLCPMSLLAVDPAMGPLQWTPTPMEDDSVFSACEICKEMMYYNWDTQQHEVLSLAEMCAIRVVGCRGGSPRAMDVEWQEPGGLGGGDGRARAYRECVLTDALSLADVVSVVAGAYYRDGNRPPRGMTLRWILTDPLRCRVRLEFKSALQAIAEQCAAEAGAGAPKRARVAPAAPVARPTRRVVVSATADVLYADGEAFDD